MNNPDPLHQLRILTQHKVPFVTIGGHAVAAHGYVRATEDTDIIFHRTPESERALMAALHELNARWISDEIDPETKVERQIPVSLGFLQSRRVCLLITDYGFLDIFDHVPGNAGLGVEDVIRSAIIIDGIPFASREALIAMKKAAGRPRDALDLERLADD